MNIEEKLHGFVVKEKYRVDELSADVYVMRHARCGARLVFIDREDDNKTFSVSFRTVPEDSTGVFHILEHSVLCGSEKFPVKDPFVELLKGSLNTFLNAMTFQDKTMYPVSSRNDKDFLNLVDIYMDAVLHPLAVSAPYAFYQEGWHYELDEKTGELCYKGVVLNEMRGDYSSPESQIDRNINAMLYPDTCYGEDSGGDPEKITDLTYGDFVRAHEKYYHPSGAEFFLDGSVKLCEVLGLLDSYLSEYERTDGVGPEAIKKQPKIPPSYRKIEYEIPDGENKKNKTRVSLGYIVGDFSEKERLIAIGTLFSAVFSNNESPAKAAIIESGICEDLIVSLHDGTLEPSVTVDFINVCDGREEECESILRSVVCEIAERGIDRSLLEASLNAVEFRLRERDYGTLPAGVVNAMLVLESLLYSDDPVQNLRYEDSIRAVRALEDGYYERLLLDLFINNDRRAKLVMLPSNTLGKERAEKERKRLENIARGMTDEEKKEIIEQNRQLLEWQECDDSLIAAEKIPSLSISDISDKVKKTEHTELSVGDSTVLFWDIKTGGITYVEFFFDITDIDKEDLPYLFLLCALFTNLPTKSHTALDLQSLIKANLGSFDVKMTALTKNGEPKIYMQVSVCALSKNTDKIAETVKEILNETLFTDEAAIRNFIRQTVIATEESFASTGHQAAIGRAAAATSVEGAVRELYSGYEAHIAIKALDSDFDNKKEEIKERMQRILKTAATQKRLVVSVCGECDKNLAKQLVSAVKKGRKAASVCKISPLPIKKEGIQIPARVSFAAISYNLSLIGEEPSGAFDVVRALVGYEYLWSEIRVKGGAYGAGMVVGISGNLGFYSYRDPTPERTLDKFSSVAEFLRRFAHEGRDITKYIIGAVGDAEPIRTPRMRLSASSLRYLRGIIYERECEIRRSMLSTDSGTIKKIADIIEKCVNSSAICVVGGEDKLDSMSGLLEEILKI